MTVDETKKILAYIANVYPRYYSNVSADSAKRMAITWCDVLQEYSVDAIMAGVKAYISADASGFPPAPGQIISYIHLVGNPRDHSGTEAWALVRRAVNVPWDQFEASYNTLPKVVQRAVGSAESLKEMALMDLERFETVAQSNFLRMYDAVRKREATESRIAAEVHYARPMIEQELYKRSENINPVQQLTQKTIAKLEEKTKQGGGVEAPSDMMARLRERLK